MKKLQIHPSHVTLGILVKAYGQAGDVSRVLRVWEEMGEQRRQASAVTYGCMIDACVKCGYIEKAVEIFHGMEKDLTNALLLFREMKDEGVPCNTITYNSIID